MAAVATAHQAHLRQVAVVGVRLPVHRRPVAVVTVPRVHLLPVAVVPVVTVPPVHLRPVAAGALLPAVVVRVAGVLHLAHLRPVATARPDTHLPAVATAHPVAGSHRPPINLALRRRAAAQASKRLKRSHSAGPR